MEIKEEDVNALALMVLSVLRDTPEFGTTAHLAYTLSRKDFNRIIDMFGGQTIRIPTREDVNKALSSIIYYHSKYIRGRSDYSAIRDSHLTVKQVTELRPYLEKIDYIMNHFSGEYDGDSKS